MVKYFAIAGLGFLLSFCTMQPKIAVKCALHRGKNYPIIYYYSHSDCINAEKNLLKEK